MLLFLLVNLGMSLRVPNAGMASDQVLHTRVLGVRMPDARVVSDEVMDARMLRAWVTLAPDMNVIVMEIVNVNAMAVVTMKQREAERRAGDHNGQQQNGKRFLHGMNLARGTPLAAAVFSGESKTETGATRASALPACGVHWNYDDSYGCFPAPQPQALLF